MNAPERGSEADSACVRSITIELPADIAERLAACHENLLVVLRTRHKKCADPGTDETPSFVGCV